MKGTDGHGHARRARSAGGVQPLAVGGLIAAAAFILPAPAAAQQDKIPPDTLAADSVLTARQRALLRLRALPVTPIQRDTMAADSLAADSLAADSLAADTLAPDRADVVGGMPGRQIVVGDSVRAPAAPLAADSVVTALRRLGGYEVTEYRAEGAAFDAETERLRLSGRSRVGRAENALNADSLLVYSGATGVVCGYGRPVLEGEQDPVESERLCYDIDRNLGMAEGARTTVVEGATWYVRGADNRVYLLTGGEQSELYGEATEFTSCDLPDPHYTFRAGELKMRENDVMIAKDVTLQFGDVPVFWLPWMVQSMKQNRRSGLLMPQFGANDIVRNQSGYRRHISNLGFYWALNDYMSARTTYEWFSGNWQAVTGALSYRWLRQFLNGGVTFTRYWRESGATDLTISTQNGWQPDERTRISVNGNFASSSEFVRRNSFSPRELNRNLTMSGSANRSFEWGSLTVGAQRVHQLSTDKITSTLPSVGLTLSPLTLWSNADATTQLTWSGGANVDRKRVQVPDSMPGLQFRDSEALTASAQHSLGFGRFSIRQNASYSDDVQGSKPALFDTAGAVVDTALATAGTERLTWNTSASFQQGLWTGTTLTPNVSIRGGGVRFAPGLEFGDGAVTADDFIMEPTRVSVGAGLNTSVFGFWPGVGPFSRIRHKISPSLGWSYSPAPAQTTALQDSVFGVRNLEEQNRVTLTFNQTFEAKYAESDTAAADTAAVVEGGEPGAPRRLPQARKVTLLALSTGATWEYDFVAAALAGERSRGFLTQSVTNSVRSDLLRGFQLSVTHDLFREGEDPDRPQFTGGVPREPLEPRTFDPFLTRMTARFSIDDDFWLFRALGLAGGPVQPAGDTTAVPGADPRVGPEDAVGAEASQGLEPGGVGSIVNGRSSEDMRRPGGIGGWNASLNYSLIRSRPGASRSGDNQMVTGNFSFRPTEHWSVRWSTGYSFTDGEFSDHILTLSRDLHRWQANFDFIKAQNGNFAFSFRVNLLDNPDLKLDYDQRTDPNRSGLRSPDG